MLLENFDHETTLVSNKVLSGEFDVGKFLCDYTGIEKAVYQLVQSFILPLSIKYERIHKDSYTKYSPKIYEENIYMMELLKDGTFNMDNRILIENVDIPGCIDLFKIEVEERHKDHLFWILYWYISLEMKIEERIITFPVGFRFEKMRDYVPSEPTLHIQKYAKFEDY